MTYKSNLYAHIRPVTLLPCCILSLLGRLDSRKGEQVAFARINAMMHRCSAIENRECLTAEKKLFETRVRADEVLTALSRSKNTAKVSVDADTPTTASAIRAKRRREARISQQNESNKKLREELCSIRETIIKGNAVLTERISKTRSKAKKKIDAYLRGLYRSGKMSSFRVSQSFSNEAITLYREHHAPLDDAASAFNVDMEEVA